MNTLRTPRRLDRNSLRDGVYQLVDMDPDLASVTNRHEPPPLWNRRPGFESLIRIILEQQVSLASARAIFGRVKHDLGEVSAQSILRCGVNGLKRLGVTRQKSAYCVDAARRASEGALKLKQISRASDVEARVALMQVKGVGPWTADIYLLMALGRPDIWPTGDLALLTALQVLKRLPAVPTNTEAAALAAAWSPWRSVAARILWHGYLQGTLRKDRLEYFVGRDETSG